MLNRTFSALLAAVLLTAGIPAAAFAAEEAAVEESAAKESATEESTVEASAAEELRAADLNGLSEADVIAKVAPLFTEDEKNSGILASVSMAQFILESGFGHSELAVDANNCFGMKTFLSGNTWPGSVWDGVSVYSKQTREDDGSGNLYTITADFRSYPCIRDSIADHSAYLLGAQSDSGQRYPGLKGCTDYEEAIRIIREGGYATSTNYIDELCRVVETWDLTQYNLANAAPDEPEPDAEDTASSDEKTEAPEEIPATPLMINVISDTLDYTAEPVPGSASAGQISKGLYIIVDVRDDMGELNSGNGWVPLTDPGIEICGTICSHES